MSIKYPAPDLPPPPRRMIHGIASTERVTDSSRSLDGSDNCVMLTRGCALDVPIPLLYEHSGDAIGKVIHLCWIGNQLYCRAVVFDNAVGRQTWQKIARYELRGLSCGFQRGDYEIKIRAAEGVVKYFKSYRITEISIVRSPRNRDCYFAVFAGGSEARVAGQRSGSEIRHINDRAREVLKRVDERLASQAEEKKSAARKEPSVSPRRNLWASDKEWLSPAERRRFDNWYKNSFTDDGGDV